MNIIDIAQICGLSKSTVSRYLTGGSVSAKSAQKIARAIEQTGFEVNASASRLKTNRSNLIGVLIDGIESVSITRTLTGVNKACREHGFLPFVVFNEEEGHGEIEGMRALVRQGVDGIVYGSMCVTDAQRSYLNSCGKPALILGQSDDELPYCKVDDFAAGHLLGEHIRQTGAHNIVYLSFPRSNRAIGAERSEGFLSAFEFHGAVANDRPRVTLIDTGYAYTDDTDAAIDRALALEPDCIVAASDRFVLKILEHAAHQGLRIPEDCLLAGFGNHPASAMPPVSLTSIDFDYRALGHDAAERIIKLIQGDKIPHANTGYPFNLVVRASTGGNR